MALLGLFSKRDKHKSPGSASSATTPKSSNDSVADSSEDYILADSTNASALSTHVYGNPEASSSKFHLGFRKKSNLAAEVTDGSLLRPLQQSHPSSSRSEADMDEIRPPPAKASLFSAYGDPHNALSTRSLPSAQPASAQVGHPGPPPRRSSDGLRRNTADVQPVPKKPGGGLFAWAHRERKKSKTSEDKPELPSLDTNSDSFNLKAFRHIRPESPSADSSLLAPPTRPRPRNGSTTSDTSQRISVAAFREMAARRSAAGSPTASPVLLRPPSRTDSLEHSPFRSPVSSFQRSPASAVRSSSLAVSSGSTSSESSDSGETESDEGSAPKNPKRQKTITQKSPGQTKPDAGDTLHAQQLEPLRSISNHSEVSSDSGHSSSQSPKMGSPSGSYRARASVSTSAMQPNAAAKRASLLASTKPPVPLLSDRARGKARARDSDSDDDSHSSSEDSDDAPLASFMRPSRPGSAASNTTSASRSRIPPKPLIDITKLTTPPLPPLPTSNDQLSSPKRDKLPTPPEKNRQLQALETNPALQSDKPSITDRLARVAQTTGGRSVEKLADAQPLERRSVDSKKPLLSEDNSVPRGRLPTPTRSQTAPMGSLDEPQASSTSSTSPTAGTHTKPRSYSSSSPNPAAVYDLTDPTPIVPTPIRQRSPPPAFSVTSRPASQLSLNNSNQRLSGSQSTVRTVDSGSASSSPTTPNTPWMTSDTRLVTTAHLQKQAHVHPPPGHFSSSPPATAPRQPMSASLMTSPSPTPTKSSASSTATSRPLLSSSTSSTTSTSSRPSPGSRQRSATLIPHGGMPPSEGFTGGGLLASRAANPSSSTRGGDNNMAAPAAAVLRAARQRSSTLLPHLEISPTPTPRRLVDPGSTNTSSSGGSSGPGAPSTASSSASTSQLQSQTQTHRLPQRPRVPFDNPAPNTRSVPSLINVPPQKPFARPERGNSPASSTGDSSSGRTPLTPADGSEFGYPESKSMTSAVPVQRKGHRRGASVSFEEADKEQGKPGTKSSNGDEERRKERRRGEAKAAIEYGNVVNGHISFEAEEEDQLGPLNNMGPRMSMVNPMLNFTPPTPVMPPWQQSANPAMLSPSQFMVPPSADPRFFAAHQHAMMVAKQAYQMAVAQQALAAANEEWERGSTASALSGMSMGMGVPPMGMGGMGMGMGMTSPMGGMLPGGYGMQWANPGSMMFPSSASMYAGSVLGSELGAGAGWGTQSEYGGPSRAARTSAMFASRPTPAMNSARSDYGGPNSANRAPTTSRPTPAINSTRSEYGGPNSANKAPASRPRKTSSDAPSPPHSRGTKAPPSSWKPTSR